MTATTTKQKLDFVIETKELIHALTFANSVVEKRNVSAELASIKLITKGNILELVVTDMGLYLNQSIGAQVFVEGEIAVSTQLLTDIIRKIPDKELKLHSDGKQLKITGERCNFSLLTLSTDKFPIIDTNDFEFAVKVACINFAKIIDYTEFSMSTDETRYNLTGIYIHVSGNTLYATSTDGHRLSVSSAKIENKLNQEFGVILPRKTVYEITKIIKDHKNIAHDIEILLTNTKAKFICNTVFMISKLIDGVFPDYQSFIPVNNQNKLLINTKLLANAIDRVATITIDKFKAIKITIDENAIEITASGEAKGEAKEIIEYSDDKDQLCSFTGNSLSVGFNPKYLTDVLCAIDELNVVLDFNDSFSPVLIKPIEKEDDMFVIMPVKV